MAQASISPAALATWDPAPVSLMPLAASRPAPVLRPAKRSNAVAWLVALSVLIGGVVVLYRTDLLLEGARRAGREAQFLAFEKNVLGGPARGTPRELRALFPEPSPPPEAPAPAAAAVVQPASRPASAEPVRRTDPSRPPETALSDVDRGAAAPPARDAVGAGESAAAVEAAGEKASGSGPAAAALVRAPVRVPSRPVPEGSASRGAEARAKKSADGIPVVTLEEGEPGGGDAEASDEGAQKPGKRAKRTEEASRSAPAEAAAPPPSKPAKDASEASPPLTGKSFLDAAIRAAASEISKKPKKKPAEPAP
jgi:hypothetical protein